MATAKKLPSGSYRCRIYAGKENGKDIYKSFTAPTKKEAEYLATQYLIEKDQKKQLKSEELFCDEMKSYILKKEAILSPSTILDYKKLEKSLLKDYLEFCMMRIRDIEQNHVQEVINDLSGSKSPKTVRNYNSFISAVLRPHMHLNTALPQKEHPDLYIPSDEEIKTLITAVKDTELEIPVLLGAFCMMRRGEICGLSMSDVKEDSIHVHHSLVLGPDRKWHLKAPKTVTSDRFVSAPEFVIKRIKELGCITTLDPDAITRKFVKTLKENNIPHFRFHDLRHYSASIRHALNIPDAYIMEEGGWSSDRVLKAVYRHTMSDRKKEMSTKINNHFKALI